MAGKHCAKGDCGAAAKQNKQRQKSNEPEQKEEKCDGCTEIDLHGAPCKVVYGLRGNQKEIDEIQKKYDDELRDLERKFEQLSAPFFQRRKALILGEEDVVQSEVDQGKTAVEKQIAKLDRKTSENQDTTTGQTSKIEEIESEDDADDKKPKRVLKKKGQKEVEKNSKAPEASAAAAPAPPEASDATPKAAVKGVPKFWLTVLQHEFDDLITKRDEAVLEYLTDIECTSIDNDPFAGYILTFHFAENPFFSDAKLVKTYHLEKYFNDRILVRTEGCTIDWKARSLNTTMEIKKKTQKSKTKKATRVVEKEVKVDSFFDFFHPPQIPQDDEVEDDEDDVDYDELEEQIEYDYEIGNTLKEEILPLAVDSYLGFSALSEGSWMYPDMRGLLNAADAQGLQLRKNNGGEAQECKQQ